MCKRIKILESHWQAVTTEEDRRFFAELEPCLVPCLAQSIRRQYLRYMQIGMFNYQTRISLETFVGVLLVNGLQGMAERLEKEEQQIEKKGSYLLKNSFKET